MPWFSPGLSPCLLVLVILLPLCIGEMTLGSPLAQGVSWVSQSDLSCWMPHDRLFVKLLCSVCSCPPPLLTVSPLWIWRAMLCFTRLLAAGVGPKRARTHLCYFCGNICWLTCPLFNFLCLLINFSLVYGGFNVQFIPFRLIFTANISIWHQNC